MCAGARGVRKTMPSIEEHENLSGECGEAAQIHLIVAENSGERLGGAAAEVIKIHLRDQRGVNVIVPRPFQRAAIAAEDVPFEIPQAHRSEPRSPKLARGMQ